MSLSPGLTTTGPARVRCARVRGGTNDAGRLAGCNGLTPKRSIVVSGRELRDTAARAVEKPAPAAASAMLSPDSIPHTNTDLATSARRAAAPDAPCRLADGAHNTRLTQSTAAAVSHSADHSTERTRRASDTVSRCSLVNPRSENMLAHAAP